MKSKQFFLLIFISKKIIIVHCFYSLDGLSSEHFSDHYTGPSLLSDDIFDKVDELFEGSDEDKLKAYEILVNLNDEVNFALFFYFFDT